MTIPPLVSYINNTVTNFENADVLAKPPLVLPYMIMQPALRNRKEFKCVFFAGVLQHICFVGYHAACQSFSFENHERLIEFSTKAIVLLKRRCPAAIVDGLVRVDVMETNELEIFQPSDDEAYMSSFEWCVHAGRYYRRKIVVNEFEGVQANYKDSAELDSKLARYWVCILNAALDL
jgi:hypothetical protein